MDIGNYLSLNARRHPEKIALIYEDKTYTYYDFNLQVNQFANGLRELGIKKGEKVALFMSNNDYFPLSFYALAKIGAVIVPVNFRLVAEETQYILNQSDSVAVITEEALEPIIEEARKKAPAVRHVITAPTSKIPDNLSFTDVMSKDGREPDVEILPEDDILIMYTSGTTGVPKGALFDHGRLQKICSLFAWTLGLRVDERVLHVAPLFHVAQLNIMLNPGIILGYTSIIVPEFKPEKILELIEKHKVTVFFGVPTMYNMMLQVPNREQYDLSSIRICAYGAAPMSARHVEESISLFGTDQFFNLTGLTEGGPSGIYLSPDDHKTKTGCSGKHPLPFTEVKLVDPNGIVVQTGVVGEVLLRGATIMKEYYNNPKQTAETIVDGWLHTGDLAVKDEEGFITYVDRIKDMIISGGENIYSAEVENALGHFPKLLEAAVVGTPDPKWGEIVNALVVLKPGETAGSQEVMDFCKKYLAGYKIPRRVMFVNSLPRNASGKLQKFKLREEFKGE